MLGQAALLADVPVRMSEIHGMAQRGGVVESAMVFGDVKSTIISDGEADVLLGFEPVETLRALNKCNPKTVVITNTSKLPPFTVCIGKGVYPELLEIERLIKEKNQPAHRPRCRSPGRRGRQCIGRQYCSSGCPA